MVFPNDWVAWTKLVAAMFAKMSWVVENGNMIEVPGRRRIKLVVEACPEDTRASDEAGVE